MSASEPDGAPTGAVALSPGRVPGDVNHHFYDEDLAEALLSPATPVAAPPSPAASADDLRRHPSHAANGSSPIPTAPLVTASFNAWSPPVAPAVVVVEERGGADDDSRDGGSAASSTGSQRSGRYAFPVATIVRDLVRTGMENVQNVRIAAGAHAADVAANTGRARPLASIRSEPALASATTAHPAATAVPAYSARSFDMPMALNGETEFILVDGDLIALPAQLSPDESERGDTEDDAFPHRLHGAHRACRPTRFQRGVRRLNKLFRRRREDKELRPLAPTTTEGAAQPAAVSTSSSAPPPVPALPAQVVASGAPIGDHTSEDAPVATNPPNSLPSRATEPHMVEDAHPPTIAVGATTALPKKHRRKMISWRQQNQQPLDDRGLSSGTALDQEMFLSRPPNGALASSSPRPHLIGAAAAGMDRATGSADGRTESVTASFVGTTDQLLEADVLSASVSAEAYVEYEDPFSKKEDTTATYTSLVPRDADYKVDKADGLDVESMLRRAAYETTNDIEPSEVPMPLLRRRTTGKTSGSSIPLSLSCAKDESALVHNDMLKVVMVGCLFEKTWLAGAIRESTKRPRKRSTLGVDVHTWSPPSTSGEPIKYSIWDVQGATSTIEGSPNFGGHPATQSLFFSSDSLYILVYDLAVSNLKTHPKRVVETEYDDPDDEDYDDEFAREEANRHADRALQADIQSRVLSWVDCIARRATKSAILPCVVISDDMSQDEVKRRSMMMQTLIEEHIGGMAGDENAPKLLTGEENVTCVRYTDGSGVNQLQEMINAIATDTSQVVFQHVGTPVPNGAPLVYEIVRRLKLDHKLVLVDHLLSEVGNVLEVEQVFRILEFLDSIGEILYYSVGDDVLSRYVILSRKWLVSAVSCILRNDLNRELEETRRFMNMQCLYSNHKFQENDLIKALVNGPASSCPLLSDSDANMLWQSMSFMREAADQHSLLGEDSTTAPSMFYFLEKLLVHTGVFIPLRTSHQSLDKSQVFFVPSLLAQVDPRDIWSFKSSESWMCVLCNSWLFRYGAPSNLVEHIAVELLDALFSFSKSFNGSFSRPQAPKRAKTVPIRGPSLHEFYEDHNEQAVGRVRVHQIMCWQSSMVIKIGTVFAHKDSDQLRESFVEILVTVVDQSSNLCVASDAMRSGMHRVIVSGKGQIGHHGQKLWEGGYQLVMDSVRSTLEKYANVDAQVVCPECLAHSLPHSACTWSQDSVLAIAEGGNAVVRCMRGHRVDSHLICGSRKTSSALVTPIEAPAARHARPVSEMLFSVVLVGLYDMRSKRIASVGSGFVIDRKIGLVVTAGHVLFNMEAGRQFGIPHFGIEGAKIVIGISPGDGRNAVFRYFAEIVADDIHSVDAAVLHIKTRMENDVDDDGPGCAEQSERPLDLMAMQDENLRSLKLTTRPELEEAVRILGFNQGGEGILEQGRHLNRSFDFAKGYVCKIFKMAMSDDSSSHSSDSSSHCTFTPREEIVIMCPTISGHSGGPCVNDEGKVIGILSRVDPVDRQRCYLVPANEIKILVTKARKQIMRPASVGLAPPPK